jgi:hypothetical protein
MPGYEAQKGRGFRRDFRLEIPEDPGGIAAFGRGAPDGRALLCFRHAPPRFLKNAALPRNSIPTGASRKCQNFCPAEIFSLHRLSADAESAGKATISYRGTAGD